MIIQNYPDELNYVNAKLHPLAPRPGTFLELFCHAVMRADNDNYELCRPVLRVMMHKYPADAERLAMEKHDSGT